MDKELAVGTRGTQAPVMNAWQRALDSDIFYSFKRSPLIIAAATVIAHLHPRGAPAHRGSRRTIRST